MVNEPEINAYIKNARAHGLPDSEIKQNLLNAGWTSGSVLEGFQHLESIVNTDALKTNAFQQPENFAPNITSKEVVEVNPKKRKGLIFSIISLVVIVLIVVALFAVKSYAYSHPIKFLSFFNSSKTYSSYHDALSVTFTDATVDQKSVRLDFGNSAYINLKDPGNLQADGQVNFAYAIPNQSIDTHISYRIIGNVLYVDFSGVSQFIKPFVSSVYQGPIGWVKFDLDELQKDQPAANRINFSSAISPALQKKIDTIWTTNEFLKITKFAGQEKINGINTLHFVASFDKDVFVKNFAETVSDFLNEQPGIQGKPTPQDMDTFVKEARQHLDAIVFQSVDVWVGMTNFKIYKTSADIGVPSLASSKEGIATLGFSVTSSSASRDEKRLSDVRQMATGLELYYNDHSGYPAALNGVPVGFAPNYIANIPLAPTPADGSCNDYYNGYWYQPMGKTFKSSGVVVYSSYELSFCLGNTTGTYVGGLAKETPAGIQSGLPCTDTSGNCESHNKLPVPQTDIASKTSTSLIHIENTFSDIGKIQSVEVPTDTLDISKYLETSRVKARDAKRLADMQEIRAGLELYYANKQQYPTKLDELSTSSIITTVPVSPLPQDGTCTADENTYKYTGNGKTYTLSFCLGNATANYPAGVNTLNSYESK